MVCGANFTGESKTEKMGDQYQYFDKILISVIIWTNIGLTVIASLFNPSYTKKHQCYCKTWPVTAKLGHILFLNLEKQI